MQPQPHHAITLHLIISWGELARSFELSCFYFPNLSGEREFSDEVLATGKDVTCYRPLTNQLSSTRDEDETFALLGRFTPFYSGFLPSPKGTQLKHTALTRARICIKQKPGSVCHHAGTDGCLAMDNPAALVDISLRRIVLDNQSVGWACIYWQGALQLASIDDEPGNVSFSTTRRASVVVCAPSSSR